MGVTSLLLCVFLMQRRKFSLRKHKIKRKRKLWKVNKGRRGKREVFVDRLGQFIQIHLNLWEGGGRWGCFQKGFYRIGEVMDWGLLRELQTKRNILEWNLIRNEKNHFFKHSLVYRWLWLESDYITSWGNFCEHLR